MILITGGTGFIGSNLIKHLLLLGKPIRSIKRPNSIIPEFLKDNPQVEWVDADLLDFFSLEEVFRGVSEVYHCAAIVSYSSKDKRQIMQVNIEGTSNIVNLCLDHKVKLVYVSSVAALGSNEKDKAITEKNQWVWNKNKSNYSISKYEAEREVWRGIAEGLDGIIVNPSIVIGIANGSSKSTKLFELLEKGSNFYPPGSAGFVNVRDVVNIMIDLMSRPDLSGKAFILNERNISYKDLFSKYASLFGNPSPHYIANKNLLGIAWRMASILRALGINRFGLTKEIAQASIQKHFYSNRKIVETLNYSFIPLDESLKEIHSSLQ